MVRAESVVGSCTSGSMETTAATLEIHRVTRNEPSFEAQRAGGPFASGHGGHPSLRHA